MRLACPRASDALPFSAGRGSPALTLHSVHRGADPPGPARGASVIGVRALTHTSTGARSTKQVNAGTCGARRPSARTRPRPGRDLGRAHHARPRSRSSRAGPDPALGSGTCRCWHLPRGRPAAVSAEALTSVSTPALQDMPVEPCPPPSQSCASSSGDRLVAVAVAELLGERRARCSISVARLSANPPVRGWTSRVDRVASAADRDARVPLRPPGPSTLSPTARASIQVADPVGRRSSTAPASRLVADPRGSSPGAEHSSRGPVPPTRPRDASLHISSTGGCD